ncbi:MAG TPA: hypothetical protein VGE11_14865 [Pseudonocardia sp.]
MPRLRRVLVLLLCVLVVAVLAGLSVVDPFHLRQARWFTSGFIALGLVLLTAALAVAVPRGGLRWFAMIIGVAAVLGWGALVFGASTLAAPGKDVGEINSGGLRLVTIQADRDPAYAVVLRSGGGPFEQESLVYQGPKGAPQPAARFVDKGDVEVAVGTCRYQSKVEGGTMAVEPVHRPLVLGC